MSLAAHVTGTRPADARVTLAQIGRGVLMSCGARDFVSDDPNGTVMFRVGPTRKVAKVIVTLLADDTYRAEFGYMHRKTLEWITVEVETGIYADQLAATVRRLGDRERY